MRNSLIGTTIGVELEYVGATDYAAGRLADDGWAAAGGQHGYHCTCASCNHHTGLLWRYQRDSTVEGEFITRILSDWPTARLAFRVLEQAIEESNNNDDACIEANERAGLHVHVMGADYVNWELLCRRYLWYERWMQLIGSGPFPDKREGMNITFLQAIREQGRRRGEEITTTEAGRHILRQVDSDRHIDLNYSRGNGTFEFRVFNSTTEAWQMELAARLAYRFTTADWLDYPATFRLPANPIQTLEPPLTLEQFVHQMERRDAELGVLIRRQLALYPDRILIAPQPEEEPEPEIRHEAQWRLRDDPYMPFASDDGRRRPQYSPGGHDDCGCIDCATRRERFRLDEQTRARLRPAPPLRRRATVIWPTEVEAERPEPDERWDIPETLPPVRFRMTSDYDGTTPASRAADELLEAINRGRDPVLQPWLDDALRADAEEDEANAF